MSPGGLCSLALGLTVVLEPLLPQPGSATRAARGTRTRYRRRMAAKLRRAGHRAARPRSTRGKNAPAPATVGCMSERGVLLVEDDEAIASGLIRVLESQGHTVRRLPRGGPAIAEAGP